MSRWRSGFAGFALALAPATVAAQDLPWYKDVEHACIQNSLVHGRLPCNELSHTALNVVGTVAISAMTGLKPETSRWFPFAFSVGKEVRDVAKWGLDSQWRSSIADLSFDVLGWWLAPKMSRL